MDAAVIKSETRAKTLVVDRCTRQKCKNVVIKLSYIIVLETVDLPDIFYILI